MLPALRVTPMARSGSAQARRAERCPSGQLRTALHTVEVVRINLDVLITLEPHSLNFKRLMVEILEANLDPNSAFNVLLHRGIGP